MSQVIDQSVCVLCGTLEQVCEYTYPHWDIWQDMDYTVLNVPSVAMDLYSLRLPSILLTTVFTVQKGMNVQSWYNYFPRV